jgi:hypothetical protein
MSSPASNPRKMDPRIPYGVLTVWMLIGVDFLPAIVRRGFDAQSACDLVFAVSTVLLWFVWTIARLSQLESTRYWIFALSIPWSIYILATLHFSRIFILLALALVIASQLPLVLMPSRPKAQI